MDANEEMTLRGEAIADEVRKHFAGQGPRVQAVAIADLFGTFLAGFPECHRAAVIGAHIDVALQIARLNDPRQPQH